MNIPITDITGYWIRKNNDNTCSVDIETEYCSISFEKAEIDFVNPIIPCIAEIRILNPVNDNLIYTSSIKD